jgi:uncharacterized protein (TIGR02099 family)
MALRKVGRILLYACAGALGLAILVMLAITVALDRVPHYQAEIKDWVHAQIGYRIAFARVSPAFRWYGPELYFDRFELRSKDDQRVLARAAGGRIGVDLWQLLRSGKLFAGRIELDSPDISVSRTGQAGFALGSEIKLGTGDAPLPAVRLDDLPAGTLAIRHGRVTVRDWNPALPLLELRDVALDLRRGDGVAQLSMAARLPVALAGAFSVHASARGSGSWDTLDWTVRVRARGLSCGGLRELFPDYLARLESGTGGFELAAVGRGADLTRADLDFDASGVTTQLANEPGVKFDQIAGVLTLVHSQDRWSLRGRRVRALSGARRDPESEFDVNWRGDDRGLVDLRMRASYLRAETLLPLAGLLPQKDLRERLQEIEPTGEWLNTRVDLTREAASVPWRFTAQAQFRGVGFAAVGRSPGLRGLNGDVRGTELGGRVDIHSRNAVFAWPAELPQPVALESLDTTLYWKHTPEELLVATPSIGFKNPDAGVSGRVAWQRPSDGGSPVLIAALSVDDGNVASTHLYLPHARLPAPALAWLNRALVAGHLSHADVAIDGPIWHFPFRDGTGMFLARAQIADATLDYRENWPRAEDLAGIAEFRNEGMRVQFQSGRIGAMNFEKGEARFADFKTAELELHATAAGDAGDGLALLRATPLDAMAEHMFSAVQARGPAAADVDLFLPFKDFEHRRIQVRVHLNGVALNRQGSAMAVTELNGDAELDGAQVARADIHGRVLGGAFLMQARSARNAPVTRTMLVFNGSFSGESLRAALSLPAGVRMTGVSDWHGVLRIAPDPARERSLHVNASLVGLDLELPEPLAKPAGRALPSTLEIVWPGAGPTLLRVALGSVLHGQAAFETGAAGPQLARASVTFGAGSEPAAFSDTQVVNTGGTIERLDLGGWLKLYPPEKAAKPMANFLRSAKFDVGEIDYLGLTFRDVSLDLAAGERAWRIGLGGPNVVGSITLPGAGEAGGPWKLEFQRLKFDDATATATATADAAAAAAGAGAGAAADVATADPRAVPALHFHAADMIWGERQLGEVTATLTKLDDGIAVQDLTDTGGSFTIEARGEWRGRDAGLGRIEGTLSSTDVAATMKELGYADVIEARSGKMDFDLAWLGAPTAGALSAATGHVQVALDKGQITGLRPGAGRVVGLASIAALPRRLALDFSDLTDKGFAFDTIRGSFDLREGSAYTDDVLVKGPAAEIGLIGRVGLKSKDYDQTAVVTGNVGSSLSLAAFAGGPVVGAAVLLFSQVFKQPLKGLARGYYRITGNWDNPTVERIKSADATATAEAPK